MSSISCTKMMQLLCISTMIYKYIASQNKPEKHKNFQVSCWNNQTFICIIFFLHYTLLRLTDDTNLANQCGQKIKTRQKILNGFSEKRGLWVIQATPEWKKSTCKWANYHWKSHRKISSMLLWRSCTNINVSGWSQSHRCAVLCSKDFYWNTALHQFRHQQ